MATAHLSWTVDNTVGIVNFKIRYRLSGTSIWSQFLVAASGTTTIVPQDSPTHVLQDNYLYDFQITTINNNDNPSSAVFQGIGIHGLDPTFSPINVSISYSFPNLSPDIDSYTATIATYDDPGDILATHELTIHDTITDTFTGLSPLTTYVINILVAANQFTETFTYLVTTTDTTCASPTNTIATLS